MPHSPFKNPHFHDSLRQPRTPRAITRHIRRSYMRRKTRTSFHAPARVTKSADLLQLSRRSRAHSAPKPKCANPCQPVPNHAIQSKCAERTQLPAHYIVFPNEATNPHFHPKNPLQSQPARQTNPFSSNEPNLKIAPAQIELSGNPPRQILQPNPQLSGGYPVSSSRQRPSLTSGETHAK